MITATEAARSVQQMVRETNGGREMPAIPELIRQVSERNKVYIYNVGPWGKEVSMSSDGRWFIPKCEEGQKHSAPLIVPGVVISPYPENEKKMGIHQEDGRYFAHQIIGVGPMRSPAENLTRFGIFIAAGEKPTAQELAEANKKLTEYCESLVKEARQAHSQGAKAAQETIGEEHKWAASRLNLNDETWLGNYQPKGLQKCPACASPCDPEASMCATCQAVINRTKFDEQVKAGIIAPRFAGK